MKCPDPEVLPSWVTERNSTVGHVATYVNFSQSAEEPPRLEMTRTVLFEITGNSSTVPEFQYRPDPVNEFSGRFPENSRAAREFSSGWRKATDANSRAVTRA